MSHEVIQELLSAYLDDDLSSEERQRVDEHLAVCEDCRDELARSPNCDHIGRIPSYIRSPGCPGRSW